LLKIHPIPLGFGFTYSLAYLERSIGFNLNSINNILDYLSIDNNEHSFYYLQKKEHTELHLQRKII